MDRGVLFKQSKSNRISQSEYFYVQTAMHIACSLLDYRDSYILCFKQSSEHILLK